MTSSDGTKQASRRLDLFGRMGGAVAAMSLIPAAARVPIYARLMWELLKDDRVPAARKALLGGALGYIVLPWDIIPDRIPVIGRLDDLLVVIVALDLFIDGVPSEVLDEKLAGSGIARTVFDDDIAQLRRIIPRPVRRFARKIPNVVSAAAEALRSSGLGPKVRSWIDKEEEPS